MHHTRLKIVDPCAAVWEAMPGDDLRRYCEHCDRDVIHVSAMRADAARKLLEEHTGQRLCVRYSVDTRGDIVFQAPAPARVPAFMLTALLLAACAAHGHELDEPIPPEAGGWCSLEEEAAGQCAGESLKPEPVFVDPESTSDPEESPLTTADPRSCNGPLAVEVALPVKFQLQLAVEVPQSLDASVGVRLGGTAAPFFDAEAAGITQGGITVATSKAQRRRNLRQLRREARSERRRDRSS